VARLPVVPVVEDDGDVLARYQVRLREIASSAALIRHLLDGPPGLHYAADDVARSTRPATGIGIVEGWRGAIVHRVEIDADRRVTRVKVVDPSWFNWPALPVAMADTIVPDFPLANKSFNLSYAGNDL
jgi:Ni,Fe-hydrogenase III large subunit